MKTSTAETAALLAEVTRARGSAPTLDDRFAGHEKRLVRVERVLYIVLAAVVLNGHMTPQIAKTIAAALGVHP